MRREKFCIKKPQKRERIFIRKLSPGAKPRKNFKEHFGSAPIQVNALAYTPSA